MPTGHSGSDGRPVAALGVHPLRNTQTRGLQPLADLREVDLVAAAPWPHPANRRDHIVVTHAGPADRDGGPTKPMNAAHHRPHIPPG